MPDQLDQVLAEQPAVSPPPIKRPNRKRRAPPSASSSEAVLIETPVAELVPASISPPKPKRSKPARRPFTPGEVAVIKRLAGTTPANEIAKLIGRGPNHPQVAAYVRQLGLAGPTSVPVHINDSKVACSGKTWAALAAAARRRSIEPALLAVQIIDGVLRRGSIDAAIHTDVERAADRVQVVLDLEAVGHVNGAAGPHYRLRGIALATNSGCPA